MAPFPTSRLSKALNLAPLAAVEDYEFTTAANRAAGNFVRPNYAPQKNFVAWGNRTKDEGRKPGFFGETQTNVIRIWADWYSIQLNHPYEFNDPCLQALDRNIQAARSPGAGQGPLTIILAIRGFPSWATGFGMRHPQTNRWVAFGDVATDTARNTFIDSFPDPDSKARAGRIFDAAQQDRSNGRKGAALSQLRWPGSYDDANQARDEKPLGVSLNGSQARFDLLRKDQHWFRFVEFLARRYHPDPTIRGKLPDGYPTTPGTGPGQEPGLNPDRAAPPALPIDDNVFIDVLEVVNEPNVEIWPQTAPSGKYQISARNTAEIIRSTKEIEAKVNGSGAKLYFAAPATSDGWYRAGFYKNQKKRTEDDYETRFRSSYDQFLKRVARDLGANFVAGENFIFSHHNYQDIEDRRRAAPDRRTAKVDTNSAAWVLQLMRGRSLFARSGTGKKRVAFRWRGWPTSDAPRLILTEGGAREGRYKPDKGSQRDHVRRAFQWVRDSATRASGTRGNSYGVVLFSNFLTWKDPDKRADGSDIPTSKSDLVDYISIQQDRSKPPPPKMPVGFYPLGTREPDKNEYETAQRPVYDTWRNLSEERPS